MPRRAKRKTSNIITQQPKGDQHLQKQLQPQPQGPKTQVQQPLSPPDVEFSYPNMFLNATSQRRILHGKHGGGPRQTGGLESSPYFEAGISTMKSSKKGNSKAMITSKSSQFTAIRPSMRKNPSHEVLMKTASSYDGWMLQKSKASASKIRLDAIKASTPPPSVSPLARNRFYELRDKTPVRDNGGNGGVGGANTKRSNTQTQQQRMDLNCCWMPLQQSDLHLTKPTTPGAANASGMIASQKRTPHHLETYLGGNEGSRNWFNNWRIGQCHGQGHGDLSKNVLGVETLHFPEPLCRQESHMQKPKVEDDVSSHRYRRPPPPTAYLNENDKIAPLQNLAAPVRDLWVSRPEHANYNQFRCVRILPEHHQCAGPERNVTPNDVDTKSLANKLEKHCRMPRPGTRAAQCICFRKTRRAYCTVCKATIIGRAFRKCRVHPEVGFLTDHFYCPFCCAEPSALKDL